MGTALSLTPQSALGIFILPIGGGWGLFLLILVPTIILGIWAQHRVKSTYNKYVKVQSRGRITGAEAAQAIMQQAGINDVAIIEVSGQLTDHYDPTHKRLALSSANYRGTSLAALGVSAHEAGHAIQHKVGYKALQMRMSLIPVMNIASKLFPFLILASLILPFLLRNAIGIKLVVVCYAILTLFQLITLPVEFDASKRARKELVSLGIIDQDEQVAVVKTLNAAAWTYVAALVSSLAMLVYWIFAGRR